MDFLTAIDIGRTALSADRVQLNVTAMNLANIKTTRTPEGGPFQRRSVVMASTKVDAPFARVMQDELTRDLRGVRILGVARDATRIKSVYEPSHPDANKEGYVLYPDINVVEEMTNMLSVSRSYEASVGSISTIKGMWNKALEMAR